jgi:hypothetical protein
MWKEAVLVWFYAWLLSRHFNRGIEEIWTRVLWSCSQSLLTIEVCRSVCQSVLVSSFVWGSLVFVWTINILWLWWIFCDQRASLFLVRSYDQLYMRIIFTVLHVCNITLSVTASILGHCQTRMHIFTNFQVYMIHDIVFVCTRRLSVQSLQSRSCLNSHTLSTCASYWAIPTSSCS